ncbi:hypothetical protein BD770DRAFT_412786 [Pilaira anomala]|nr:hypothetical protein BD770DRAFT_412786 [Pilaira anomala]
MRLGLRLIVMLRLLGLFGKKETGVILHRIMHFACKYLNSQFFERLNDLNTQIDKGLSTDANKLFETIITKCTINGGIKKKELRIVITEEKVLMLKSDNNALVQILDITKHCITDRSIPTNDDITEFTYYCKFVLSNATIWKTYCRSTGISGITYIDSGKDGGSLPNGLADGALKMINKSTRISRTFQQDFVKASFIHEFKPQESIIMSMEPAPLKMTYDPMYTDGLDIDTFYDTLSSTYSKMQLSLEVLFYFKMRKKKENLVKMKNKLMDDSVPSKPDTEKRYLYSDSHKKI